MARCWKTTKIKYFLVTVLLLSTGVYFTSAHTAFVDEIQTSSEKDEYEIRIKNENNTEVITLLNPKPDKEMLREYIFVRVLERPYGDFEVPRANITKNSESVVKISPEDTTEDVSPIEEISPEDTSEDVIPNEEEIPSAKVDLEVDSSPHGFTNGHGFQYFFGHTTDEDNEVVQPRKLTKTDQKYTDIGKVGTVNNSIINVIPAEPINPEKNQFEKEEFDTITNKTNEDVSEKLMALSNDTQSTINPIANVIKDVTTETNDKTSAEQLQLNFEDSFSRAQSGQEPLVKRNYNDEYFTSPTQYSLIDQRPNKNSFLPAMTIDVRTGQEPLLKRNYNDEYFTSTTQYPLIDQSPNKNYFLPALTIDVRTGMEMLNSGVDTKVPNLNLIETLPIMQTKINGPHPTAETPFSIIQISSTDTTRQSVIQNTGMPQNMHGDTIIIPETSESVLNNKGNTIVPQLPSFEVSATIPLSHFKIGSLLTGRDQFKDLVAQVNKQATNAALTQVGQDSIGSVTIVTRVTKDVNTTHVTIKATAAIHVTNSEDVSNNEESLQPIVMSASMPKLLLQENGSWKTEDIQFKDVVARVNEQATETVLAQIDKDSSTSVTVVTKVAKELNASDVTIKATSAVDVTNEKEFIIPNTEFSVLYPKKETAEPNRVADTKTNFENHARVARNLLFNKMKERYLKMYSPTSSDDKSPLVRRKRSTKLKDDKSPLVRRKRSRKLKRKRNRRLRGRHLRSLRNDEMKDEIDHRVEQIFSGLNDKKDNQNIVTGHENKNPDKEMLMIEGNQHVDCANGELSNHIDENKLEEPMENVIYTLSNTQSLNTYGMSLTEGQGHVWNNLVKPRLYYEIATPHVAPQIEERQHEIYFLMSQQGYCNRSQIGRLCALCQLYTVTERWQKAEKENKFENEISNNQNIPGTPVILDEDIHNEANTPPNIHESHVQSCAHDKPETHTEIAHGDNLEINDDLEDIPVNIHKSNDQISTKPDIHHIQEIPCKQKDKNKPTHGTVTAENDKDLSIHHGVFYEVGLPQTSNKQKSSSSIRRKRDLTEIPEPPTLPELDTSRLPKNIRALFSTKGTSDELENDNKNNNSYKNYEEEDEYDSTEAGGEYDSEDDSGEMSNVESNETEDDEDKVKEYKNKDNTTSTSSTNSESDNVKLIMQPHTYGMSLDSGHGYVWNNLVNDPAKVYKIGDPRLDDNNSNNEGDGEQTHDPHEAETLEANTDNSDVKDAPELDDEEKKGDKNEDQDVKPNNGEDEKESEKDKTNTTLLPNETEEKTTESSEQPTQHGDNEDNTWHTTPEPDKEAYENEPENTEIKDNENVTDEDTTPTIDNNNNASDATSTTCKHGNETDCCNRPINIEELVKNGQFWKWLNDWTTSYLDKMKKHVKELVAEEVTKQIRSKHAEPIKKFSDSKPSTKPKDGKKKDKQKKDNKDKTPLQMEAQNVYGNSVGDGEVTNIFLFYSGNDTDKMITNLKPLISSSSKYNHQDKNENAPNQNEEVNNSDNIKEKLVTPNNEPSGTNDSKPKSLTPKDHLIFSSSSVQTHTENKKDANSLPKITEKDNEPVKEQRPLNSKEHTSQHNKFTTTPENTEQPIEKNERDKVENDHHIQNTTINKTTDNSTKNKSNDKEGTSDKIVKSTSLAPDAKLDKSDEKNQKKPNESEKNEEASKDSPTKKLTTLNTNNYEKPNNKGEENNKDEKEHAIIRTNAEPLKNTEKDDQDSSITSHHEDKDGGHVNSEDENKQEEMPAREKDGEKSKKEEISNEENKDKQSNKVKEPPLPKLDERTKEAEDGELNKEEKEDKTKSAEPEKHIKQDATENQDPKEDIKPDIQAKEDKTFSTTTEKEASTVSSSKAETPKEKND